MENILWLIGIVLLILVLFTEDAGCVFLILAIVCFSVAAEMEKKDKPESCMDVEYRIELVNQNTVRITNGYRDEKIHIDSIQVWMAKDNL